MKNKPPVHSHGAVEKTKRHFAEVTIIDGGGVADLDFTGDSGRGVRRFAFFGRLNESQGGMVIPIQIKHSGNSLPATPRSIQPPTIQTP